jgi:outer membrane protein
VLFRKSILLTTALFLTQHAQAESLTDIYNLALKNDYRLKAAYSVYSADKEAVNKAKSVLLPQITLSGNVTKSENTNQTNNNNIFTVQNQQRITDSENTGYSISLSQPLFDFSAYKNYQRGELTAFRAKVELESEQQNLIMRVAQLYLQILKTHANYSALIKTELAFEQNLISVQQKVYLGVSRAIDIDEAQASYDSALAEKITSKNQLNILFDSLSVLTGKDHTFLSESFPHNFIASPPVPQSMMVWQEDAARKNLDINIAKLRKNEAKKTAQAQNSKHLPTLHARLNYADSNTDNTYNFAPANNMEQDGWSASINLSIPIYSGGGVSAAAREASYRHLQQEDLYRQIQRQVKYSVRANYMNIISGVASLKARRTAITSREAAMKSAQQEYATGLIEIYQLIDTQTAFFSAQRRYFDALYSYFISSLQLKEISGSLAIEDIAYISNQLNHDGFVNRPLN